MATMPRVLACDPERPDPEVVAQAVRVLAAGGLVAFPTETVYGLGARALDPAAIARVFEAKGRPATHPLIAHVTDEAMATRLAARWTDRASRLARTFWPGPLTLVVARAREVPAALAGGGETIAVRAPAHPIAHALIEALGEPIAAPSANRYQQVSPTAAAHVVKSLGDRVDLVLDGGACEAGIESTVVDVSGAGRARVLRPGALELRALRAVEPDLDARIEVAPESSQRPSPGMDPRHYAPRAKLVVVETVREAQRAACGIAASGAKVGVVMHSPRAPDSEIDLSRTTDRILTRKLPAEATAYARALFATLHELDDAGVDAIVVEGVPEDEAWWAVSDRLRRGAS